jgi:hypothetical protein
MPSSTYALFRNAILGEQQIVCRYDGRPRELCPHIIGTNKSGEEVVLAWQFGGTSSGMLPAMAMPEIGQRQRRPRAQRTLA